MDEGSCRGLEVVTCKDVSRRPRVVFDDLPAPLGWPHVLVSRARDRPLARFVVGASGMILGASTGMFVGGMLGVILAMALLPLLPNIAVALLVVTTVTCGSAGAVVGSRVLQRETFDEVL